MSIDAFLERDLKKRIYA